jgi:hypothetical protein
LGQKGHCKGRGYIYVYIYIYIYIYIYNENHSEDAGVDGTIILRLISRKLTGAGGGGAWTEIDLAQGWENWRALAIMNFQVP